MAAKLELVSEWLNNDPDKSWDKLASALRQIGHINLSDKISAYGRGMLFSIVLSCSNICTRKYIITNLFTALLIILHLPYTSVLISHPIFHTSRMCIKSCNVQSINFNRLNAVNAYGAKLTVMSMKNF